MKIGAPAIRDPYNIAKQAGFKRSNTVQINSGLFTPISLRNSVIALNPKENSVQHYPNRNKAKEMEALTYFDNGVFHYSLDPGSRYALISPVGTVEDVTHLSDNFHLLVSTKLIGEFPRIFVGGTIETYDYKITRTTARLHWYSPEIRRVSEIFDHPSIAMLDITLLRLCQFLSELGSQKETEIETHIHDMENLRVSKLFDTLGNLHGILEPKYDRI